VLPLRKGRKKLQDLFVDDKVPRFRREEVRMAVIDSEVLWIPLQEGLIRHARYTAAYSVGAETTEFVVIWKV
jgi:tRNA(Ile)-lysidine synthase